MRWTRRSALAGVAALALATLFVPPPSQSAGVTNGGLGWSNDNFTATQRLDLLDGSQDELPAAVGPNATFNPTGDAILYYRGGTMGVLHANGIVDGYSGASTPEALHGVIVAWSPDESYAVVGTEDGVFRVADGSAPVVVPDYFGGGVARGSDGAMAFAQQLADNHTALFTADPLHPGATPVQISPSWCSFPCGEGENRIDSIYPVSWDAPGERLLVDYLEVVDAAYVRRLGWYTPGDAVPQAIDVSISGASEIFLSPDNTELAYNHGSNSNESTRVVDLGTGATLHEISGHHWGWQPCVGTCASFDEPVPPSRIAIGRASSGRKGGKATATVRWSPPASPGTNAVDHIRLVATPVGALNGRHKAYKNRAPGDTKYVWRLARGKWKFRACAYNTASPYCMISNYSNVVVSR